MQQQQKHQQQVAGLAFPTPTKKEPAVADPGPIGNLGAALSGAGPLNLTSSQAAMAAAALNNLNRQIQQQQGQQAAQGAMGGLMGSNLLLRNMLQYGQAAAAAQGGAGATGTAPWPPAAQQHFNA